jgi:hypothetical protein
VGCCERPGSESNAAPPKGLQLICGRSESAGFMILLFSPQIQIDRRLKAERKKWPNSQPAWAGLTVSLSAHRTGLLSLSR